MRKFFHIVLLLFLAACTREQEAMEPVQEDGAPDGRVRITFSCSMPHSDAATKALGEESNLETMHLAIFGGSGYYKEYVPADKISGPVQASRTFVDSNGDPYQKTVDTYVFTADIKLSNTKRTIHFIGNGPASIKVGKASDVLPNLLGEKETAFWQMITLPEITAATDADGNFLNPNGDIRQPGEEYMVSGDTQAYFSGEGIGLIRNWAKIILRNWPGSNFTPISFAAVNVPKYGTLLPYGGKTGFIENYHLQGFDDLYDSDGAFAYKGNLPEGTEFDSSVPDLADFVAYDPRFDSLSSSYDSSLDQDAEPSVYLYERPVPSETTPPSYVIVYGIYNRADDPALSDEEKAAGGVHCFYKVDLMDKGEYYPVYRNFKYRIEISKITARGHDTAAAAAASAGSADVSADINASHLADISDGTRRMAVQPWLSHTYITGGTEETLSVVFYDDITGDDPQFNLDQSSVWCTVSPAGGGVIKDDSITIGAPSLANDSSYGFRHITYEVCDPDEHVARTQTIRIYCKTNVNDGEETPLYRDIVLTLQPKQVLKVNCTKDRVLRYPGEEQTVNISIPDGLVQSMFPLVFTLEPVKMTLTPDNSMGNLPVVYGNSIDPTLTPGEVRPVFQFQRTLTWEEYNSIRTTVEFEDESRWKTFSCYFKTNCEASATTVWVANEFFIPASDYFSDYRSFRNAAFTTSIPRTTAEDVKVKFAVEQDNGVYPEIFMKLQNLTCTGMTYSNVHQAYVIHPTMDEVTLTLGVATQDGNVAVTLYTEDDSYEPVTLRPWRFYNVGFIDAHYMPNNSGNKWGSNSVFGHVNSAAGKNLLFGYCTDSDNPTPTVEFKNLSNINSSFSSFNLKTSNMHQNPYSGLDNYWWASMTTQKNAASQAIASFTLSAVGYVEENVSASRFNGYMLAPNIIDAATLKNKFSTRNDYPDIQFGDNKKCYASIEVIPAPEVSDHGLVLEAGQTYRINVDFYDKNASGVHTVPNDADLFYIQLDYYSDNGVPMKHLYAEPIEPEESQYYQYPGNAREYIWSLPRGSKGGTLEIKAPNTRNVEISSVRMMAFQGTLND